MLWSIRLFLLSPETGTRLIMPENVHLVVVPPEDLKLDPVTGKLKIHSSTRIHEILSDLNSALIERLTVTGNKIVNFVFRQGCTND